MPPTRSGPGALAGAAEAKGNIDSHKYSRNVGHEQVAVARARRLEEEAGADAYILLSSHDLGDELARTGMETACAGIGDEVARALSNGHRLRVWWRCRCPVRRCLRGTLAVRDGGYVVGVWYWRRP